MQTVVQVQAAKKHQETKAPTLSVLYHIALGPEANGSWCVLTLKPTRPTSTYTGPKWQIPKTASCFPLNRCGLRPLKSRPDEFNIVSSTQHTRAPQVWRVETFQGATTSSVDFSNRFRSNGSMLRPSPLRAVGRSPLGVRRRHLDVARKQVRRSWRVVLEKEAFMIGSERFQPWRNQCNHAQSDLNHLLCIWHRLSVVSLPCKLMTVPYKGGLGLEQIVSLYSCQAAWYKILVLPSALATMDMDSCHFSILGLEATNHKPLLTTETCGTWEDSCSLCANGMLKNPTAPNSLSTYISFAFNDCSHDVPGQGKFTLQIGWNQSPMLGGGHKVKLSKLMWVLPGGSFTLVCAFRCGRWSAKVRGATWLCIQLQEPGDLKGCEVVMWGATRTVPRRSSRRSASSRLQHQPSLQNFDH